MSASARSRYILSRVVKTTDGIVYVADREPYRFRDDPNNRLHRVIAGDTFWSLAEQYFPSVRDAANLWWIIADYQRPPVIDPTIKLRPGGLLVVPPESVVLDVLSERRRDRLTVF